MYQIRIFFMVVCIFGCANVVVADIAGPPYWYQDASTADLIAQGFVDVTGGVPVNIESIDPPGSPFGNYSNVEFGDLPNMGFIEFTLTGLNSGDNNYMGFWLSFDIQFTDSNFQLEEFMEVVNNGASGEVVGIGETGTGWSAFTDWIPESYWDGPTLHWFPTVPPDGAGFFGDPQVYNIAWDFSDQTIFPGVDLVSGVLTPTPATLTLFVLTGLVGRRRR
jgi:hypothetical protein